MALPRTAEGYARAIGDLAVGISALDMPDRIDILQAVRRDLVARDFTQREADLVADALGVATETPANFSKVIPGWARTR